MVLRRIHGILLLLVLGIIATGCAREYENVRLAGANDQNSENIVLAVIPFQGISEAPGSGLIVADILANQLYANGGYVVMAPEEVATRLASHEGEVLSPREVGKLTGTPYILTGRLTEYTYKSGVGENPVIGLTARLFDTSTGSVVWSATSAQTGGGNWFQEDSLSYLAAVTCQELVESLDVFFSLYASVADDGTAVGGGIPRQETTPNP